MTRCNSSQVSAVVLAGGRATRMGGIDKGLIEFAGKPLVEQICAALAPQVAELMINANRNLDTYRQTGYAVVEDQLADYQGPLAGMQTALRASKHPWLLTIPCDGPFVPPDYAAKMITALNTSNTDLAVAHDGERLQPVYALISRNLADSLTQFLHSGERKIDRWYEQHNFTTVDFNTEQSMFTNINTPEQLTELERNNVNR